MSSALILAAGLGTRMRPLTLTTPKPLVAVKGKALLEYALEACEIRNIERIVINAHYLADQIESYVKARRNKAEIIISDERAELLDSGGGVVKALPHLSDQFYVLNADTFWLSQNDQNLQNLADNFTPHDDFTMLLATKAQSVGFTGKGDFDILTHNSLKRNGEYIYAGAFLTRKSAFANEPIHKFSLNKLWDKAITTQSLKGVKLEGKWYHIGDIEALKEAESLLS